MGDQRLFERFDARFPVKFQYSRRDFGTDVFLRDASGQGVRMTTRENMSLHDNVSLLVELPDGFGPLTLTGRIVWKKEKAPKEWDIGMEFHKPNLMKMHRMYRLVENMN